MRSLRPLLTLTMAIVIVSIVVLAVGYSTLLKAQNITNPSDLTGIENTTTSASVTARQNISPPEIEPEDYPTPSATDE